jgi:hypothetical protein
MSLRRMGPLCHMLRALQPVVEECETVSLGGGATGMGILSQRNRIHRLGGRGVSE